jgi:hypothetical protein
MEEALISQSDYRQIQASKRLTFDGTPVRDFSVPVIWV